MSDASEREACCEHGLIWHHESRGCGYLGFTVDHRCSCLLPFNEALAARDRAVERRGEVKALREAARVLGAPLCARCADAIDERADRIEGGEGR